MPQTNFINNNLSSTWAFSKTQVHCSKNVITRKKIVKTIQIFALHDFLIHKF